MNHKLSSKQIKLVFRLLQQSLIEADESLEDVRELRQAQYSLGAEYVRDGGDMDELFASKLLIHCEDGRATRTESLWRSGG